MYLIVCSGEFEQLPQWHRPFDAKFGANCWIASTILMAWGRIYCNQYSRPTDVDWRITRKAIKALPTKAQLRCDARNQGPRLVPLWSERHTFDTVLSAAQHSKRAGSLFVPCHTGSNHVLLGMPQSPVITAQRLFTDYPVWAYTDGSVLKPNCHVTLGASGAVVFYQGFDAC